MAKQMNREELRARIAANPDLILLEALPEKYYTDGHLPGALHMPHDRVRELVSRLIPDNNSEIVVYCASRTCQNSHIAANLLGQMGYRNVTVYGGGKQDWIEAGLALEASVPATA
ncbi:MAG: rhodanese-like domain-containing protein [Betaproteobacteria bacterium]|nr:rhodanese-like domain-containing protein [Betaproteobacteria bacterium]